MSDLTDPDSSAELAAFSVMRALLRTRSVGTEVVRSEIAEIVNDLDERFGPAAVITLAGALGAKALAPLEEHAQRAGTTVAAELDADEQQALTLLENQRRGRANDT